METFFILTILIFLPAGWFLLRMLRYTRETVGEDSPLYKERSYQFTARQYFGTFRSIANPILGVMMLVLVFITSMAAIQQHKPLLFIFSVFFFASAGFLWFVIYFDWQYWKITRNVTVTFNPYQPSIMFNSPIRSALLTPENVIRIEQHQKDPTKVSKMVADYGYYLFFTVDGQIIQINNIFIDWIIRLEFLKRFFPNTPVNAIWHRSTWNTDLDYQQKPDSPNFAA